MELLAIISLSTITWLFFRVVPKNPQTGNAPRYLWICYFLPFLGSAALFGGLDFAVLLLVTRGQADPITYWLYPMLIRSLNMTYIPITVLCIASCVVQLCCIVMVKLAPTMNRIWLAWNLIVTSTLTAALAFGYHW